MALPLIYNLRSVRVRWASTSIAVLGIAGVVAVFVAMLAMARGFKETRVASGSPGNNPRVPSKDEIIELYREIY